MNTAEIRRRIVQARNVIITAHKNIDLDAVGSALGMYYIVTSLGKNAYFLIDDEEYTYEVKRALDTIKKEDNIVPVRYNEIKKEINNQTLLIVTDTSSKKRIQNPKLTKIKEKIIIDHHIRTKDTIKDAYEWIDEQSSSATEMCMLMINELNVYIPSFITNIMIAGIYIDTNGLLLKTTDQTHLCISNLYKFGANNIEVQYLLKQNFNQYKEREKLVLNAEIIDKYAITTGSNTYMPSELAKSSDMLLTFNNIEASFTVAKLEDNVVGISARSLGNVDVEEIMKKFNGGGHKTDAAAQIKSKNVEEVKEELIKYLGGSI